MKLQHTTILFNFLLVLTTLACSTSNQNLSLNNSNSNASVEIKNQNLSQNLAPANDFEKEWKNRYESTRRELEKNRILWQESKIVNYDFVCEKIGGGMPTEWDRLPVLIKVRDRKMVSIEKVEIYDREITTSKTDGFEDFDTIDKLFQFAIEKLAKGRIIWGTYHKKLGYPQRVGIDSTWGGTHNGVSIRISKFEIVK